MSFGYSVSDFVAVGQLDWKIYKVCKDAPESFKNIAQEVLSLHAVLKELEETYPDANFSAAQQSRLRTVGDGCRAVLEDLQGLVDKYNSLGTNTKRTWDRLAWGSKDIANLRSRLISNTGLLTTFINASQVTVQKKLDIFLQEFRDGKREGSIISTQTIDSLSMDERQAWRAIRKGLEDIGISIAAFDANKDFIVNWLKTSIVTGVFEEETAEGNESSSVFLEDDLIQSFENRGPDDTVLYQPSKDVGNDTNLTITSAGLQASKISPRARISSRRPPRVVALVNWLFRYNKNLIKATESGDEAEVRQALEKGADIDTKNQNGNTAFHLAVSLGHGTIVQLLLDHGANIKEKDTNRNTALHNAADYGHETVVQMLLNYGAYINEKDQAGRTALHWAAISGRETVVQLLLNQGAIIDQESENRNTALQWAATSGQGTVLQLLLDHGANINEKNLEGFTALHHAAYNGHETVVQLLLKSGANVNEVSQDGSTALHSAADNGHWTVVKLLLKSGVDVNNLNQDLRTALHKAAYNGHLTVVQLLLESGALINTGDGYLMLKDEKVRENHKLVKLLEHYDRMKKRGSRGMVSRE